MHLTVSGYCLAGLRGRPNFTVDGHGHDSEKVAYKQSKLGYMIAAAVTRITLKGLDFQAHAY